MEQTIESGSQVGKNNENVTKHLFAVSASESGNIDIFKKKWCLRLSNCPFYIRIQLGDTGGRDIAQHFLTTVHNLHLIASLSTFM